MINKGGKGMKEVKILFASYLLDTVVSEIKESE